MSDIILGISDHGKPPMEPMDPSTTLLEQAEQFRQQTGMSERQLGIAVMNDPSFFPRIRSGGSFTTRTFQRFQAYFAANWPQKAS
jgi:hypothetical protein